MGILVCTISRTKVSLKVEEVCIQNNHTIGQRPFQ